MGQPYITIGDTLLIAGTYRDASNALVNFDTADIEIEAWALSPDGLTKNPLTTVFDNQVTDIGKFAVSGDTTGWVAGIWSVKVRTVSDSGRFTSPPIEIEVAP